MTGRRKRFLSFVALIAPLLLVSCGGGPQKQQPDNIRLRYDGKELSFEPKYARFATFRKALILKDADIQNNEGRVSAVVHRIYIANYDLQLTDPAKQDHRRISFAGEYRVEIQIEADANASQEARLRVGEYVSKPEPFGRISYVFMSYFKDGRDRSENLQASEFGGKVKITSVTDAEIAGEIDVFDSNEFVKGSFRAQRLPN